MVCPANDLDQTVDHALHRGLSPRRQSLVVHHLAGSADALPYVLKYFGPQHEFGEGVGDMRGHGFLVVPRADPEPIREPIEVVIDLGERSFFDRGEMIEHCPARNPRPCSELIHVQALRPFATNERGGRRGDRVSVLLAHQAPTILRGATGRGRLNARRDDRHGMSLEESVHWVQ